MSPQYEALEVRCRQARFAADCAAARCVGSLSSIVALIDKGYPSTAALARTSLAEHAEAIAAYRALLDALSATPL